MSNTPLEVARACLEACIDKDRAAIEALSDDDSTSLVRSIMPSIA
jgi:hypothetical protein